jgi:aldose 1-epimerase
MTPTKPRARTTIIDGVEVVELADAAHGLELWLAPGIGNMAYRIGAGGQDILWFPYRSPAELKQTPVFCGIPFLAPWANRIDGDAYWANGKKYLLNAGLGDLRLDGNRKPIHGLLNFSPLWKLAAVEADERGAWATSRLEFWRYPELMAQFPFAHTLTMTHRLANGEVEIETLVENHSEEPMPVAVGYHPYFRLNDAARDQWRVHVAARERLVLNEFLIPTGERVPAQYADPQPLAAMAFDDVFTNLARDADGKARFWFEGKGQRVTVTYGPKYRVAVVYAPRGRDFLCFEPMAAITNAFNLDHSGVYRELESIPAGGTWRESFWIGPSGF